jgi:hypothetical protein
MPAIHHEIESWLDPPCGTRYNHRMRIFLRLLILWLIMLPIGWFFGLPWLISEITDQTKAQNLANCLEETKSLPGIFDPAQPLIAQKYCDCVVAGITVTREDVWQLAQKKQPVAINQRVGQQIQRCNQQLENPGTHDAQVIYF